MSTQFPEKKHTRRILLPRRLRPGDRVRLLSPASPVGRPALRAGMAVLRSLDLRVTADVPSDGSPPAYLAGSDADRAAALNAAFRDPETRAVFCARGGYGTARLLPHLDEAAMIRDPKIVMGFSDITGLLAGLYRRCGLVGFHGPVAATFSGDSAERGRIAGLLFSDSLSPLSGPGVRTLQPGTARGPLAGGNLSVFCGLLGTPFFPPVDGSLLFLEEIREPLYKIDRLLTQLRLAGVLDRIAGLALGSWTDCGPPGDLETLILERLNRPYVPVLAGLPAGHGPDNHPFPLGSPAVLDGDRREIRFPLPATRSADDV